MNITAFESSIDALKEMAANGEDIWEAAVSLGIQDEDDLTELRWRQGDLAMLIDKRYGDDRLGSYAKAINVPIRTIRHRRQMSRFYENGTRYRFANAHYAHYREAMRLETPERALWALEKASQRGWTIERMGMILSRYLKGASTGPRKIADVELEVAAVRGVTASFHFSPEVADRLIDQMTQRRRVRIVIHEVLI